MSYNELYHHGIFGQKWGIRRYQNEDGSLTLAGRRRRLTQNGVLTDDAKAAARDVFYNDYLEPSDKNYSYSRKDKKEDEINYGRAQKQIERLVKEKGMSKYSARALVYAEIHLFNDTLDGFKEGRASHNKIITTGKNFAEKFSKVKGFFKPKKKED